MLRHLLFVAGIAFLAVIAAVLYAQERQLQLAVEPATTKTPAAQVTSPRSRADVGRGFGDWNARVLERIRGQLELTDEEWIILRPKIEPVVETQRELRRGASAWGRMGWDDGSDTPIANALRGLRTALEDPTTTSADLNSKVEAVRAARADARNRLTEAQKELTAALGEDEAAAMVLMGVLE